MSLLRNTMLMESWFILLAYAVAMLPAYGLDCSLGEGPTFVKYAVPVVCKVNGKGAADTVNIDIYSYEGGKRLVRQMERPGDDISVFKFVPEGVGRFDVVIEQADVKIKRTLYSLCVLPLDPLGQYGKSARWRFRLLAGEDEVPADVSDSLRVGVSFEALHDSMMRFSSTALTKPMVLPENDLVVGETVEFSMAHKNYVIGAEAIVFKMGDLVWRYGVACAYNVLGEYKLKMVRERIAGDCSREEPVGCVGKIVFKSRDAEPEITYEKIITWKNGLIIAGYPGDGLKKEGVRGAFPEAVNDGPDRFFTKAKDYDKDFFLHNSNVPTTTAYLQKYAEKQLAENNASFPLVAEIHGAKFRTALPYNHEYRQKNGPTVVLNEIVMNRYTVVYTLHPVLRPEKDLE